MGVEFGIGMFVYNMACLAIASIIIYLIIKDK
jgi:hypothetical protein